MLVFRFSGVSQQGPNFCARVCSKDARHGLGTFAMEEEAAEAHDKACIYLVRSMLPPVVFRSSPPTTLTVTEHHYVVSKNFDTVCLMDPCITHVMFGLPHAIHAYSRCTPVQCTYPEILPCLQGKEPKNFSASNYDANSICAMTSLAMLIEKLLSKPPPPPGV